MTENFPKLTRDSKPQIQEHYGTVRIQTKTHTITYTYAYHTQSHSKCPEHTRHKTHSKNNKNNYGRLI